MTGTELINIKMRDWSPSTAIRNVLTETSWIAGSYTPGSSERSIDYGYACNTLTAWLIQPGHVFDDGLESPSKKSICSALRLVAHFHRQNKVLPQRIVYDGEGGITMDDWGKWQIVQYDIDKDGQIERMVFEDSRLVSRENVELKQKPETEMT